MQIVINISEKRYKDILRIADVQLELKHFQTAEQIIANGTPLEQEPTTKNDLGADCISRKAVLDAIDSKAWEFCDYLISKGRNDEQKPVSHFADNLRECVRVELPSVTPKQRIGKWIKSRDGYGNNHYTCPFCKLDIATKYAGTLKDNYCSNCGAKMVEPQECACQWFGSSYSNY